MSITKTQIAKWVTNFESLPIQQKRVEIAKDALKQYKAGKYIPYTGSYVQISSSVKQKNSVQQNFDKIKCTCCLMGACLISTTKFKNKLTFQEIDYISSNENGWKLLKGVFTPRQLSMMEYAFEAQSSGSRVADDAFGYNLDWDTMEKCIEFGQNYREESDRFEAILKNVIFNNGIFKP